jgi:hypothetical protein
MIISRTARYKSIGRFFSHQPKSTQQAQAPGAQKFVAALNSVDKVAISSSLRNKRRVFISLLSVILTSFLILVSLSYSFSVGDIIDHTFNERYLYDAQIFFDDQSDQAGINQRLEDFSQISSLEAVGMKSDTISFGDHEEDVLICGIPRENAMIQVFDENRQLLALAKKGIILEAFTANQLGVTAGYLVEIKGIEVEVTAISKENINYVQYCSLDECDPDQKITGKKPFTGDQTGRGLRSNQRIDGVNVTENTKKSWKLQAFKAKMIARWQHQKFYHEKW